VGPGTAERVCRACGLTCACDGMLLRSPPWPGGSPASSCVGGAAEVPARLPAANWLAGWYARTQSLTHPCGAAAHGGALTLSLSLSLSLPPSLPLSLQPPAHAVARAAEAVRASCGELLVRGAGAARAAPHQELGAALRQRRGARGHNLGPHTLLYRSSCTQLT
jgi:hypothetical protein